MTRCWIFDIDGTLANCEHRLHHIQKKPKDWTAFFAAVTHDEPIGAVIKLARELSLGDGLIVFVSGRSSECREATEHWIRQHVRVSGPLYMRKAGDYRNDDIVKLELLAELRRDGFEPIMAFEDRARVVKAWREAGIPCAQVAEGDF